MKKKTRIGIIVAAMVAVLALLTGWYLRTRDLIKETADAPLQISSVELGINGTDATDRFDLVELASILTEIQGKNDLALANSTIQLTSDTIRINGTDASGPVHIVLTKDSGIFYRDGDKAHASINQAAELYEAVTQLMER